MKKFIIKVNGIPYEVEVEEVLNDSTAATQPVKEGKTASVPKTENPAPEGAASILAPMPGTVLKVNVGTGDTVKKGQVLLIIEAMKMENEILAPADGRVAAVNVEKGKAVSTGDIMVSLVQN